ncbi:MAG: FAD binding domain-containing protein [Chloroflexi bacterium]|nr:FAD binding domain-containing protein [Chloroflexota bacterium]
MLNLQTIHKPTTIVDALMLLTQSGVVALGGGTNLIAEKRRDVRAVVDLSALQLTFIETRGDGIAIGATTTLAQVVESVALCDAASGVVTQGARQTHANILRNQATVAGTLIAEPDGIFAVVLSALDARVTRAFLENDAVAQQEIALADFFAQREMFLHNALVTHITLPAESLKRHAAIETVARTPSDKAIVSVCAALEMENGIVRAGAVALGGVADTAWRARDAEREILHQGLTDDVLDRAAMAATSALHPSNDPSVSLRASFRGSAEYRTIMARVLTARALRGIRG